MYHTICYRTVRIIAIPSCAGDFRISFSFLSHTAALQNWLSSPVQEHVVDVLHDTDKLENIGNVDQYNIIIIILK